MTSFIEELMPVVLEEYGVVFASRLPVTFTFTRSTEKSPYVGSTYQQDIEPAGRYMLHNPYPGELPRGWVRGVVTFHSPLVLAFHPTDIAYDELSWKARLLRLYGAGGVALSRTLRRAGFDGIVTVGLRRGEPVDTREIVDLTGVR